MNRNLNLVALLVAALAGCDQVLIASGQLDGETDGSMGCRFDRDQDGFGTPFGLDGQGYQIDIRDFDEIDLGICRDRHNAGEPLIWTRVDRVDPDDTNACVGPSPTGWGVADLCPEGAGDDDDDDQGDDDDGDDDDASDDDDQTGDDDDDDSTPDDTDTTPDNGEEWVEVCYDPDDDGGSESSALEDPIVDVVYVYNHPESGWFNGDGVPVVERSGNRFCFNVQCDRESKINGEVDGSNVWDSNQAFIAHNLPNSDTENMWGRFESNDSDIDSLVTDVFDWGAGADVYLDVICD